MNFQKERVTDGGRDALSVPTVQNIQGEKPEENCMDKRLRKLRFRRRTVARMAELADATDSKSVAARRVGSTPSPGTRCAKGPGGVARTVLIGSYRKTVSLNPVIGNVGAES